MKITQRLSRVSAFSHAEDHLRERTPLGGAVSLAAALLALALALSEAHRCLAPGLSQEMAVDTDRAPRPLTLHFGLTFPALPCAALRVDVGDAGGAFETESVMRHLHDGEVHKWVLNSNGRRTARAEAAPPRGDDSPWVLNIDLEDIGALREALKRHDGCAVEGWLALRRVAGSVHFGVRAEAQLAAAGAGDVLAALAARHVALFGGGSTDATLLNASHVIRTFRFGAAYPGQAQPLEGTRRVDRKAAGVDKYFVKAVPTEHSSAWGRRTRTHQYSVTEYYHALPPGAREAPGVWVIYDTSPLVVRLRAGRLGALHLAARLCAVVGGCWALARALDGAAHAALRAGRRAVPRAAAA